MDDVKRRNSFDQHGAKRQAPQGEEFYVLDDVFDAINHGDGGDPASGEPDAAEENSGLMYAEPTDDGIEELEPEECPELDFSRPRKKRKKGRIILVSVLALIVAVFGGGFFYLRSLMNNPASLFPQQEVLTVSGTPSPAPDAPASPSPSPTIDPYAALEQQADLSMMKNIVNVMLIGVDYAEERETWSGKDGLSAAHADVMIVLAVNFDENRADLISLPRDIYAKIPGVDGIYKLNASLDCGGGRLAPDGAGFKKVCEAAEWMLGGIPVDYYYAVTMPAVKQLVDAIGGVDFDLDVTFKMQGRSYQEGFQHMDGQAVLDYLRVRKAGTGLSKNETGDANRVNRQKKMLVAIFQKIKDAGLMTKIPDLLSAFDGQLYTNCTTSQTAALALYGYNMPKENIGMHSMSGSTKNLYTWNFCFPNPKTRREIIKSVYGVDVTDLRDCTKEYATYLYYSKVAEQSLDTCKALTSYVAELIAADDLLPEFTPEPTLPPDVTPGPSDPTPIIIGPDTPTPDPSTGIVDDGAIVDGAGGMRPSLVSGFLSRSVPSDDIRRYSDEQRAVYFAYLAAYDECASALKSANAQAKKYLSGDAGGMSDHEIRLENACDTLQSAAELVASTFNYGKTLKWDITPLAKTNEIYVDFR